MKNLFTNTNISLQTWVRLLKTFVWSVLMYGFKTWTLSNPTKKRLEAMEMWLYRRMLRIPWTAHRTNESILAQINTHRELLPKIRKMQLTFLGHIIRQESLEHLTLSGRIEGTRARGRQRQKYLNSIQQDLQTGNSPAQLIQIARDRPRLRGLIAHVRWHGTLVKVNSKKNPVELYS